MSEDQRKQARSRSPSLESMYEPYKRRYLDKTVDLVLPDDEIELEQLASGSRRQIEQLRLELGRAMRRLELYEMGLHEKQRTGSPFMPEESHRRIVVTQDNSPWTVLHAKTLYSFES